MRLDITDHLQNAQHGFNFARYTSFCFHECARQLATRHTLTTSGAGDQTLQTKFNRQPEKF